MLYLNKAEKKLLDALSWHVWKTGLELVKEGAGSRGVIYVHLNSLRKKGLVESRFRPLPTSSTSSQLLSQREYKLTENGLLLRCEKPVLAVSSRFASEKC